MILDIVKGLTDVGKILRKVRRGAFLTFKYLP